MSESASEHRNDATTFVLFQPLAFPNGEREPVMPGALLSSLTATEPPPTLPTRSVAVDVFVAPVVFAVCESVAGDGPEVTPEPESVADQMIDTLALFQPAAFAAGDTAPVTTGPVLSLV